MAEAGSEATAIELERVKREELFRLMKKLAENAAKITLQQIETDSADLKENWRILRVDSQNLKILSSACSAIKKEMNRLEYNVADNSFDISDLRAEVAAHKRHLSTMENDKAMIMERLRERINSKKEELESIEREIEESNHLLIRLSFVTRELEFLNKKKVTVEAKIRGFQKMMADAVAKLKHSTAEREENQLIVKAQLITLGKKKIALEESLKLAKDARDSCRTAIAMIEQAYLRRLLKLKFDDYVELVDNTDVNILQSICARSDGWGWRGGVILKFCVVNYELLGLVATTIKEKVSLKPDRLYELSVDENGRYHIFELSAEEAGKYGFKPFFAGTVKAFDPETKKHTILYDDEKEILNLRLETLKRFGDEQPLQEQKADHLSPSIEIMKIKEKSTKRKAGPTKKQPSKRSKGESHGVNKSEVNLFVTESAKETCETNVVAKDNLRSSEESETLIKKNEKYNIQEEERNEALVNA